MIKIFMFQLDLIQKLFIILSVCFFNGEVDKSVKMGIR